MAVVEHDLKTHFCKTPNCENEAPSSRGIMAYCKTCRAKRLADPELREAQGRVVLSTNEQKVRDLLNAARRLDRAESRARAALDEVKQARVQHRAALTLIASELGVTHEGDA